MNQAIQFPDREEWRADINAVCFPVLVNGMQLMCAINAEEIVRRFGGEEPEQWLALCRPQLRPHPRGGWQWHYDPAIGEAFRQDTPGQWEQAQAALWKIYDSLDIPVLLLRGADSDLLTRETANAMQQRGPRTRCVEFAGVGHAPTLIVPEQARVVSKFLLNTAVS